MDQDFSGAGGFSWKELFTDVFSKHSDEELEKHWAAGTIGNIPSIDNVDTGCPKPWAFVRIFGLSLITYMAFLAGWNAFQCTNLLPGLIIIGSVAIPFSVLVFFFEMNVRRNVSIHLVMRMFIYGGAISILFSLLMFLVSGILGLGWLGASVAGFAEEVGKLLAVIFVARKLRYPYILNGMLFGAAVGAGFAAFESAGYALNVLIAQVILFAAEHGQEIVAAVNQAGAANGMAAVMALLQSIFSGTAAELDSSMFGVIAMRGLLSPFAHVIWTAMTAGALWSVKGSRKFEWSMLCDIRFLKFFVAAMVLHMLWNAPFDPQLITPFDKSILLGIAGWALIISLLRAGLKQLAEEKAQYQAVPQEEPGVSEIIKKQIVYVEKLVEKPVYVEAEKPRVESARDRLNVEKRVQESKEREENRERPDFSERAWKKYYQRDKEEQ